MRWRKNALPVIFCSTTFFLNILTNTPKYLFGFVAKIPTFCEYPNIFLQKKRFFRQKAALETRHRSSPSAISQRLPAILQRRKRKYAAF